MPKIRSRKRFRNTPYAYYKSHAPYYVKEPTVVSKDVEIISNKGLKLTRQTLFENTKVVNTYDKSSLGESRDLNVKGLNVGISDLPADQVSSSTVITLMNDGPDYSSVTTGVTYEHHEVYCTFHCGDDDAAVPELVAEDDDDDATVPSGNIPSATVKEKKISQSKDCVLNCHNECHKNLTVGISYFSDVDVCEECVANIEHACSQCQLAYRTKKLVGKSSSSSFIG